MNYGDRPLNVPPESDATPRTERAMRAITEAGLPGLRGAPPDLEAASEVRLAKLMEADDVMTALRTAEQQTELGGDSAIQPETPVSDADVRAAQAALNRLRHQQDAAWWLAHQDRSARELMALFEE